MNAWWHLVIALAIGLPLLALAGLADKRSRLRRHAALTSEPARDIPGYEAGSVTYVPADDVLSRPIRLSTMLADDEAALARDLESAVSLEAGWASDRFATHDAPPRAILTDALVLVCDEVAATREMLTPLQRARQRGRPLVVVAGSMRPDVVDTLAANRVAHDLGVLVVIADEDQRHEVAAALEATPVSRTDLQAGWLAPTAMRPVALWQATSAVSHFNPQPSRHG